MLRLGNGAEPETLDPHKAEGTPAAVILRDLFEGLTAETPAGEVAPGVAERWDISADRRTYVFHLRPEARWSDGESLTAGDFVYSLRRAADPRTASPYSGMLSPVENADAVVAGKLPPVALGVAALDAHTLRIHLKGPVPYFLSVLAHATYYPVHRASVERYGDRFIRPGNLVSNGAYMLASWQVEAAVTLRRNRYYWNDARTHIDSVAYYPTEDLAGENKRYLAGELDATYDIPFTAFGRMQQGPAP